MSLCLHVRASVWQCVRARLSVRAPDPSSAHFRSAEAMESYEEVAAKLRVMARSPEEGRQPRRAARTAGSHARDSACATPRREHVCAAENPGSGGPGGFLSSGVESPLDRGSLLGPSPQIHPSADGTRGSAFALRLQRGTPDARGERHTPRHPGQSPAASPWTSRASRGSATRGPPELAVLSERVNRTR